MSVLSTNSSSDKFNVSTAPVYDSSHSFSSYTTLADSKSEAWVALPSFTCHPMPCNRPKPLQDHLPERLPPFIPDGLCSFSCILMFRKTIGQVATFRWEGEQRAVSIWTSEHTDIDCVVFTSTHRIVRGVVISFRPRMCLPQVRCEPKILVLPYHSWSPLHLMPGFQENRRSRRNKIT